MEVAVIIGMILAFLLGAYVREPFLFAKKEEEKEETFLPAAQEADGERKKTKEERRIDQLNNLLNYTGKKEEENDE